MDTLKLEQCKADLTDEVAGATGVLTAAADFEQKIRALDVWGVLGAPSAEALDAMLDGSAPPANPEPSGGAGPSSRSRSPGTGVGGRRRRRSRSPSGPRRDRGRSDSRSRSRSRSRSCSRNNRNRSRSESRSRSRSLSRSARRPPERKSGFSSGPIVGAPPPGAPPTTTRDYSATPRDDVDFSALPSASARAGGGKALLNRAEEINANLHQTRHARRFFVSGFPPQATEAQLTSFFNDAFNVVFGEHAADFGGPWFITNVFLKTGEGSKNFCFIEVKSLEVNSVAIQMDGIDFHGIQLRIRRPNDFNAGAAAMIPQRPLPPLRIDKLNIVTTDVQEGPNKVFIGGLPYHLTSMNAREMIEPFGQLKAFNLIKEVNAVSNKGYAFFEFVDPAITDLCIGALHGIQIGGQALTVVRCNDRQKLEQQMRAAQQRGAPGPPAAPPPWQPHAAQPPQPQPQPPRQPQPPVAGATWADFASPLHMPPPQPPAPAPYAYPGAHAPHYSAAPRPPAPNYSAPPHPPPYPPPPRA